MHPWRVSTNIARALDVLPEAFSTVTMLMATMTMRWHLNCFNIFTPFENPSFPGRKKIARTERVETVERAPRGHWDRSQPARMYEIMDSNRSPLHVAFSAVNSRHRQSGASEGRATNNNNNNKKKQKQGAGINHERVRIFLIFHSTSGR